jgi:hypothetical protein
VIDGNRMCHVCAIRRDHSPYESASWSWNGIVSARSAAAARKTSATATATPLASAYARPSVMLSHARLGAGDHSERDRGTTVGAEVGCATMSGTESGDELWDLRTLARARRLCDWMFSEIRPAGARRAAEVGAGIGTFSERLLAAGVEDLLLVEPEPACAAEDVWRAARSWRC